MRTENVRELLLNASEEFDFSIFQPLISRRSITMGKINYPVCVEHSKLDSSERIDNKTSRIDLLELDVEIEYEDKGSLKDMSFDGVYNYVKVYEMLCEETQIPRMTGPLEGVLDLTLHRILESAKAQDVFLTNSKVTATRRGLSVGCPKLSRAKSTTGNLDITKYFSNYRSAGVIDYPLQLIVNHAWTPKEQQVEYCGSSLETLLVSFNAYTGADGFDDSSLKGLFNYVSTVTALDALKGSELNGPAEIVCNWVQRSLEKEALIEGLNLKGLDIKVSRTGFSRASISTGLKAIYAG